MNRLQHPKIIQLYDAYEYNKMVCVVLELWEIKINFTPLWGRVHEKKFLLSSRIDGGELFDRVLDDKFILTEKACSVFMRQICEAMDYIHEHNIIHLDLKVSSDFSCRHKKNVFMLTSIIFHSNTAREHFVSNRVG